MHLGRFHSAVKELANYYSGLGFDRDLANAAQQLQHFNSNKDVAHLNAFREQLHELAKKTEEVPSSFLLPSVLALHQDLHVDDFVGKRLSERVYSAMNTPGMVTEEIVAAINKLQAEFAAVNSQITGLESRLRERGVEEVSLEDSEAEFGIAFPPELVGTTAKDLIFEVSHLNRLFMSMNELLGRGTESPEVRTIAASWWQFFFELDAGQLALWTVALERIVQLLKSGYEIRKLKQDLEGKQDLIPDHFIPDLEQKLLQVFKTGISELAAELRVKSGYEGDAGRANELEVSLKQELLHLVRRVNGGAVLEVRVGEPEPPELTAEETEAGSPEALARDSQIMRLVAATQANDKLAALSHITAQLEIREDLLLEAPPEEGHKE